MSKRGSSGLYYRRPGGDSRGGAVASAEQLVGNDLRNVCPHLPAALHLLLSNQHTLQAGGTPSAHIWRQKKTGRIRYQTSVCAR